MNPVLEADRLIITLNFVQCAALWTYDEAVYLNVWQPLDVEVYIARHVRLPGDLRLAGHLDFRDAGGRSWIEAVDWSHPPHPQCTHPGVLERWEQALHRHLFTWWCSLDDPRLATLPAIHPLFALR